MRTFIAIEVPSELNEEIVKIQDQLPKEKCKLTKTKSFHITLQFLGDIEEDYIEEMKKKLSRIIFNKFTITLNSIGFFPDENYIKVVWLGLQEHKVVKDLVNLINQRMDFKPDNRFHAHITIARVRFVEDKEGFFSKVKQIKLPEPNLKFKAKGFKLVKSELTPEGPIYSDLEEFKLVD